MQNTDRTTYSKEAVDLIYSPLNVNKTKGYIVEFSKLTLLSVLKKEKAEDIVFLFIFSMAYCTDHLT